MGLDERLHEWANEQDWNHIDADKYESVNEHEYIVSDWFEDEDLDMFRTFRDYINSHGKTEFYNGKQFEYVRIDGYKYWISASHYSNGVCMNRRHESWD